MKCRGVQRVRRRRNVSRWLLACRGLLTLVAVVSLVTTLASRTFDSASTTAAVHSYPSNVKIQHRDKDAYSWPVPALLFVLLHPSRPVFRSAPQEEPISSLRLDDSCLNRPPPGV
jgi:hypothetical protein